MIKNKKIVTHLMIPVALGIVISLLPYLILFNSVREPLFDAGLDEQINLLLNFPLFVGSLIVGTSVSMYYFKAKKPVIRFLASLIIAFLFHQLNMIVLNIYNTITMMPIGPI